MYASHCCPVTMALVPTSVLLTISFFVLVVVRKIEASALKSFGFAVAVLLWVSASLVFSSGISSIGKKDHGMPMMMEKMKREGMSCPMMKDKMKGGIKEGGMSCPIMKSEPMKEKPEMPKSE